MSRARIITWSLMLGAICPDSDVLRDTLSRNDLLMITWHRSITHSLLLLPIFSLLLAALTQWLARKFHWESPSFAALTGIYAVGILSHIFLDLVTTFGTMVWSPLAWSRPAWDLIFIVDFSLSAILLVPQLLAWAHRDPAQARMRSILVCLLCVLSTFAVGAISRIVGAPISATALAVAGFILSVLRLCRAFRGWKWRARPGAWDSPGVSPACGYNSPAGFFLPSPTPP